MEEVYAAMRHYAQRQAWTSLARVSLLHRQSRPAQSLCWLQVEASEPEARLPDRGCEGQAENVNRLSGIVPKPFFGILPEESWQLCGCHVQSSAYKTFHPDNLASAMLCMLRRKDHPNPRGRNAVETILK